MCVTAPLILSMSHGVTAGTVLRSEDALLALLTVTDYKENAFPNPPLGYQVIAQGSKLLLRRLELNFTVPEEGDREACFSFPRMVTGGSCPERS